MDEIIDEIDSVLEQNAEEFVKSYVQKGGAEHRSLEGKANRLAQMIRANLPSAMQGLVVVPLFAGFDLQRAEGRIFRYDVTGGRWEEADYHATGSGGVFARGTLKKRWH